MDGSFDSKLLTNRILFIMLMLTLWIIRRICFLRDPWQKKRALPVSCVETKKNLVRSSNSQRETQTDTSVEIQTRLSSTLESGYCRNPLRQCFFSTIRETPNHVLFFFFVNFQRSVVEKQNKKYSLDAVKPKTQYPSIFDKLLTYYIWKEEKKKKKTLDFNQYSPI